MDLGFEQRGDVAVVNLPRIPLDTAFVREFTETMGTIVGVHRHVVLDMQQLLFVDSSGVGALVNVLSKARKAGGDVKLANVPQQIRGVLEVVRLDKLFASFGSVDDAVAAYGAD